MLNKLALILATALLLTAGCTSPTPAPNSSAMIQDCPNRPNCAITDNISNSLAATKPSTIETGDTASPRHKQQVSAPELIMPAAKAWPLIVKTIAAQPRSKIVDQRQFYIHAECRSRWFGFVDDLQIQLKPGNPQLLMRSAARVGYADFGVNRQRLENIIADLRSQLIVK